MSADVFSGWYSVAFGLMILRIPGIGLSFQGEFPFCVALWIQHSHLRTRSHSAGCGRVVGWESRRACCVRSTCHHEACTFPRKRGFDRVKGGERARNGWYRLPIEPTGTRVLHLG